MQNRNHWLLSGFFLGSVLSIPVWYSNFYDDAYIHARIAENILEYGTPIFNGGDFFKIGSSTGYVLVIAVLSKISGSINAIRFIETISILITTSGVLFLASKCKRNPKYNLVVALCAIPFVLLAAYGGMETSIVCLLLTGAAVSYRLEKYGLSLLFISLGTWFRFEVILLLLLAVFYNIQRKSPKGIIFYAAPTLALFAIELVLLGGVVPHAAKTKSVAYGIPFLDSAYNALSFGTGSVLFGFSLAAIFFGKLITLLRNKLKMYFSDVFFIFSAGVFVAWIIGGSLIFQWYYCLLVFPFCLAILLNEEVGSDKIHSSKVMIFKSATLLLILGFGVLGSKAVVANFGINSANVRVVRYLDIGSGLYTYCPECSLVTSEIGGLGYSFEGKVYDAFGLGDPEAAKFHPMNVPDERPNYFVGAIPPEYVEYRIPDFVVSMPAFSTALRSSRALDGYFGYDCPFDEKGMLTIFGDTKIQVFSKKLLPNTTVLAIRCEKL